MNAAIVDMLYRDEFEAEDHLWIPFHEIQNIGEFKGWMYGPMMHALYGQVERSDLYRDTYTFPGQLASAAPLIIHGAPLLRQIRGAPFPCGQLESDGATCFTSALAGAAPASAYARAGAHGEGAHGEGVPKPAGALFGESTVAFGGPNGDRYVWSSIKHLMLRSSAGQLESSATYGDGGYFVSLPRENATAAAELLDQLWADDWIDAATRVVYLYVNVWSPTMNQIVALQMLVEFYPSGKIIGSPRVLSQPITWSSYDVKGVSDGDPKIVDGGENFLCYVILIACVFTAFAWLVIGFRRYGITNFLQGLFYLDVFTLALLLGLVYYRLILTSKGRYLELLEAGRWASGGAKLREQLESGNRWLKMSFEVRL